MSKFESCTKKRLCGCRRKYTSKYRETGYEVEAKINEDLINKVSRKTRR